MVPTALTVQLNSILRITIGREPHPRLRNTSSTPALSGLLEIIGLEHHHLHYLPPAPTRPAPALANLSNNPILPLPVAALGSHNTLGSPCLCVLLFPFRLRLYSPPLPQPSSSHSLVSGPRPCYPLAASPTPGPRL